jgi:beta-barrel assembly-enhancing protease
MLGFPAGPRWFAGILALSGTVALSGCATAGSVSPQQEAQLGAQYAAEINRELPIVQNPAVHNYINQLGRSIAQRVDPRLTYTFYVVNAPEVNAFAIPGGHIYVNRGLIERSGNLSELAGVLGHEIGHVVERHGLEQMARMQNTQLGLNLGYILLCRAPGQLEQAAVGAAAQGLIIAPHSREAENEADEVAVQYLVQTGINPEGLVTMFRQLIQERNGSPGSLEQWFSTHPLTEDRIDHVSQLISALPSSARNLPRDSQAFQQFRQQVRGLR